VCIPTFAQENIIAEKQWPSYRGYYARGYLDNANIPDSWDVEKKENILWKVKVPGLALSCPVVWGDKVFLTTAINLEKEENVTTPFSGDAISVPDSSEHEWKIYCFDKNTGDIFWEKTAHKGVPLVKRHPISTHANTTVATNGKYVVAFFGSVGLFCYDMGGNLKWSKNFGLLQSSYFQFDYMEWEFSSSPIIHNEKVIIQADVMKNSFVATYDLATGEEIWKKDRDEYPGWCTPNVYQHNGKDIIAVNGYKHRGGYDFETGEEIWRMAGGGDIPVPTPVLGEDLIYFNSAHGRYSPIYAVKPDAKGDLTLSKGDTTNNHIVWSIERGGSYMGTLLIYDGLLYNAKWNGNISCYDTKTGELHYKKNVDKGAVVIASPVAADGKIYLVARNGNSYTIKAGKEYELLAKNSLGEHSMVTPAITEGAMFFRTDNYLIAVGKK
jgi:outer membrane protein assembly factor BamB